MASQDGNLRQFTQRNTRRLKYSLGLRSVRTCTMPRLLLWYAVSSCEERPTPFWPNEYLYDPTNEKKLSVPRFTLIALALADAILPDQRALHSRRSLRNRSWQRHRLQVSLPMEPKRLSPPASTLRSASPATAKAISSSRLRARAPFSKSHLTERKPSSPLSPMDRQVSPLTARAICSSEFSTPASS